MNLLQTPLTLLEIEHLLERELRNDDKNYRIVGDLGLTYEDYCFLSLKAKGLKKYENNLDMLEEYRVVILVSWVFALRYASPEKVTREVMYNKINSMQQHAMRKTITMLAETLEEYGVNTFGKDIYSIEGLLTVIGIHAGIPEKVHNTLFGIVEDSLNYKDMSQFEEQLMNELEPKMSSIYSYLGSEARKKLIHEVRDIFIDYKVNNLSEEEITNKYTSTSLQLINSCVKWCEDTRFYQDEKQMQIMYK